MVDNEIYSRLLGRMIDSSKKENRYLEFKSNYQDAQHLGEYISALSNGACLDRQDYGYLFFGVEDETLAIKGTTFDVSNVKAKGNQALLLYLELYITPKIDFHFEEFFYNGKERIVVLIVPAAVGQPTSFLGEPYIRIDSHVTSLAPYTDWIREIYNSGHDWTAAVVEGATLADLDADAILEARKGYKERYPKQAKACDGWDDATFLDRAKLTSGGKITRGTLLLVGKEESVHFLEHISQLVWKLQTPLLDFFAGQFQFFSPYWYKMSKCACYPFTKKEYSSLDNMWLSSTNSTPAVKFLKNKYRFAFNLRRQLE